MSTYIELQGTPGRNYVFTNSAKISYYTNDMGSGNTTGWYYDDSPHRVGSWQDLVIEGYTYHYRIEYTFQYRTVADSSTSWYFSPSGQTSSSSSGTITITGLTAGAANTITGSLSAGGSSTQRRDTYRYRAVDNAYDEVSLYAYVPEFGGYINFPTSSEVVDGSTTTISSSGGGDYSDSITVYTRPGTFSDYNFQQDQTIQDSSGLTATKANNWVSHCNKCSHWYNQNANNTTTSTCSATSGALITAAWYNACVDAINSTKSKPAKVTGGAEGTLITANCINALGTAISITDSD